MAQRETSGGITDMITSMFWTLAMNNQSNDTLKNHIQHDMERKNRRKSFLSSNNDSTQRLPMKISIAKQVHI